MNITFLKNKAERLTSTFADNDDIPPANEIMDTSFSKNGVFLFLAKGLICMGLLFAFSRAVLGLPLQSWMIALVWVVLAAFISLGVAYASVIRKTHRQVKYQPGGKLESFNKGRNFCLLIAFVIGSFFAMSLILEVPKWDYFAWALAITSIFLFLGVAFVVRRYIDKNYKAPFRTWGIICWSSVITALILCVIYVLGLIISINISGPGPNSALQAFLDAKVPYEHSSSVLMSSIGQVSALFDGFTQYAIAESAIKNLWIAVVWRLVIGASTFFAIANLLSICWMKPTELKRIFQPLEELTFHENQAKKPIKKSYVGITALYAVLFCCLFIGLDYHASAFSNSWIATETQDVIQDQLAKSVCIIDGEYYDHQVALNIIDDERVKADELEANAREELAPLIDASFDKRLANVDGFLDWFFSLDGKREHALASTPLSDGAEIKNKLDELIEKDIDDFNIHIKVADYSNQAEKIRPQLMEAFKGNELQNETDWMLDGAKPISNAELDIPDNAVRKLLEANDNESNLKISISYPVKELSWNRDECKQQIEDIINAERDNYLSIVGGR